MGLEGRAELDRARGALLRTPTSSEQWAARKAMLSAALTRNPTASFLWAELARADLADREPPDADGGRHAYAALRMAQVTAPREPVHTLARALLLLRHWQKLGSVTTAETKAAFTDLLLQDVANGWKYYTPFERQLLRASFELLPDRDIATMRVPLAARIGPAGPGQ